MEIDLSKITANDRGCMPIFLVEITGIWKKSLNSKKIEAPRKVQMVYKGPPKVRFTDKMKRKFFKLIDQKETEITLKTLEIQSYKLLAHLGFENQPFNDN